MVYAVLHLSTEVPRKEGGCWNERVYVISPLLPELMPTTFLAIKMHRSFSFSTSSRENPISSVQVAAIAQISVFPPDPFPTVKEEPVRPCC